MNPATILKLVLLLGVVLLVIAIGIRARLEEPLLLLRRPGLALRAMVAMYVVVPAFVLVLVWLVPLREGVGAALLGFAVSPVLPPWAKKGAAVGGQTDYVIGLQVLSSGVALLVIPLMIWIVYGVFGVRTPLDPMAVEQVLLVTVAAPLALGMGLARLFPGAAPRLAALADRVGGVVLLLGVVVLLFARGRAILAVIGQGTSGRYRGRHRIWPARRAPARRPRSRQPWCTRLGHGLPAPSHRAPARLGCRSGA